MGGNPNYCWTVRAHRKVFNNLFIRWLLVVAKRQNIRLSFFNDRKDVSGISKKNFICDVEAGNVLKALLLRNFGGVSLNFCNCLVPCNNNNQTIAKLFCLGEVKSMAFMYNIK